MKVLSVVGTRPEAIKMAPVIRALQRHPGGVFDARVCLTAQHRELLDQVIEVFDLPVHHDLNLGLGGQFRRIGGRDIHDSTAYPQANETHLAQSS